MLFPNTPQKAEECDELSRIRISIFFKKIKLSNNIIGKLFSSVNSIIIIDPFHLVHHKLRSKTLAFVMPMSWCIYLTWSFQFFCVMFPNFWLILLRFHKLKHWLHWAPDYLLGPADRISHKFLSVNHRCVLWPFMEGS